MLKRLKQFIDYKGVNISAFEKSIGMSNASFGKSLKTNGTIGADKLEIILNTYPDLNIMWLITGNGPMILENNLQTISEPEVPYSNANELKKRVACLELREKDLLYQVELQRKYIQCLENDLCEAKQNGKTKYKVTS